MSKVLNKGKLSVIMLLALSFVFSAACKKNANTGNTTSNTGGTTTTTTTGGGTTGGATAGSPTAVLKAYWEAGMKKDIAGIKSRVSAGTMRMLEEGSRKMGKSVDDALTESSAQMETTATTMPEFSNEKISGDTATVDVKSQGLPAVTIPLVKEGGEWKVALDKMIEDMKNSMGGSTGGGPAPTQP